MFCGTDDALGWARRRLPALLADLEHPELIGILRGGPAGVPGRKGPRFDLNVAYDEAVSVDVWVWRAFADLHRGGIHSTVLHVPTEAAPELGTQTAVYVDLPDGVGRLRLGAQVIETSREGFELRFERLTGEVELILEQLVVARGGARDARWVERVRRALRARLRGADARVLGLSPGATPNAIQEAYARVRQAWESFLVEGPLAESMRPLLVEYGSLLAQVCARLVTPQAESKQTTGPAGVRLSRPRAAAPMAPPPVRSAPYRLDKPTSSPSPALVRRARRLTTKLAPRPRPEPAKPEPAEPETRAPAEPDGLSKAYTLIAERAYDEAESELCTLLQADPHQEKLQQLLQLVRARRAATARDFSTAKRIYETLLRRAPNHAAAKKELIMVSALT